MQCKHEPCNNEAKGNGQYCSATCKTLFNRNKSKAVTPAVTQVRNTGPAAPYDLDEYLVYIETGKGRRYATRANPHRLNWGKRMNMNELNTAGKAANRVPIPGDHDYKGVVK